MWKKGNRNRNKLDLPGLGPEPTFVLRTTADGAGSGMASLDNIRGSVEYRRMI